MLFYLGNFAQKFSSEADLVFREEVGGLFLVVHSGKLVTGGR